MNRPASRALLVLLLATAPVLADERFAFATLDNGASIGFAVGRTGEAGPGGAIGEAVLPRSSGVSRVLWDRATGAYFGYRVEVSRQPPPRPFRVTLKPLDRGAVERELRQRADCPGCPPPVPLGVGPQFPPPQMLAEGEALTLDLLTNPQTGVRIFDVLMVSGRALSAEAMRAALARTLEGQQAVRRAAALVARGQYPAAAEQYRLALEVQPNDATVHNKLGICYQQLKNDTMARREYERALELNPAYAEVWNNLGTLEQSKERFKQAVRAYKKAIEMKPALATPWKNLGNAYLALENVTEAFDAYQEAFRLDPTVLQSEGGGVRAAGIDAATQAYYIAKVLAQKGQKDAALEFLKRAKEAGFRDFARVSADPDFRSVREDPRYKDLSPE
jgi:tetratricopeptide (TPR) repeat protein